MKTTFLKIASVVLMMTGAKASLASDTVNDQAYTDLTWIKKFDRVEVHGNVQLHLISGEKNRVQMNDSYFDHNALVQEENGVLRITCYRKERLNVWVTVNDLQSLAAYDNVIVQSEGRFSGPVLNVEMFDNAKANLDLECISATVRLNGRSMADITGDAFEADLITNYAATLNACNFKAESESEERIDPIWETKIDFLTKASDDFSFPDDELPTSGSAKEIRFNAAMKKPIYLNIPQDVQSMSITPQPGQLIINTIRISL